MVIGYWFRAETINFFEIARVVKTILVGHEHLWYLPAMIGAALVLIPLKKLSTPTLLFIALFLFCIGLVIQYLGNYHVLSNPSYDKALNSLWLYRSFIFFAFPFFAIGYLLRKTEIYKRVTISSVAFMTLIALLMFLTENYLDFILQATSAPEGFDIYLCLILLCPLIFVVALKLDIKGEGKTLALYSTGIYFVHPLFISLIKSYSDVGGTLLTFMVAILATIAAWLLIKINKHLKFIL